MTQLHCKISVRNHRKRWQPRCHAFWCKLVFTLILKQLEAIIHPVIMLTYFFYTAIRPLYRHVVCNAPVSCKANGVRNQLWAWLDSDSKALAVVFLQTNQIEQNIGFKAAETLHLNQSQFNCILPSTRDFIKYPLSHRIGGNRKRLYYRRTRIKNRWKQSFRLPFVALMATNGNRKHCF